MLTFSLLCALAAAKESNWRVLSSASPSVDALWQKYVNEYGVHIDPTSPNAPFEKIPATSASQDLLAERKAIFTETVSHITAHNTKFAAGKSTYRLGLNQFADLTIDELKAFTSPKIGRPDDAAEIEPSKLKEILSAPKGSGVDWRTDDLDIHNQNSCGSCWAFATSAMVENRYYQATGSVLELANQEMVDCVSSCWGCQGGYSYYATEYIAENGIADNNDYEYVSKTQNCYSSNYDRLIEPGAITAEYMTASGESDMASIISKGALTVAIDVVYDFFYLADGVFSPSSCSRWSSDYVGAHAISAVGYSGSSHWVIQNSWGSSWGDNGYGYISKGNNVCNIGTWDNWSWISINSVNSATTKAEPPAATTSSPGGDSGFFGTPTLVTLLVVAVAAVLLGAGYYFYVKRRVMYKEFDSAKTAGTDYGTEPAVRTEARL